MLRELDRIIVESGLLEDDAYQAGGVLEIPHSPPDSDTRLAILNDLIPIARSRMDLARRMSFVVGDRLNEFLNSCKGDIFFFSDLARKLGLTYQFWPGRKAVIFSRTSWTKF